MHEQELQMMLIKVREKSKKVVIPESLIKAAFGEFWKSDIFAFKIVLCGSEIRVKPEFYPECQERLIKEK